MYACIGEIKYSVSTASELRHADIQLYLVPTTDQCCQNLNIKYKI